MTDAARNGPRGIGDSSERPASGTREFSGYALREGQHEIALHHGETVIGRSSECSLILDGALVSRRHAVVRVEQGRVVLRDLGSRNGTAVNGKRVEREVELHPDDQLLVGNVELRFLRRTTTFGRPSNEMRRAPTMTVEPVRLETDPAPDPATLTVSDEPDENTRTGHALELLGSVVEKLITLGKAAEATRLLEGPIDRVRADAVRGREVAPHVADSAADYSVRLAEITGDSSWVVKALDIFVAQQRPLPLPIIDRLYSLLRRLPGNNRRGLDAYVKQLQARRDELSAAERFALKRLEGLIRIASL